MPRWDDAFGYITTVEDIKGKETDMTLIRDYAYDIERDWTKPYFGAVPYIRAMRELDTVNDMYGQDDAKSVIMYFLANAGTWRGETARRIKKELKGMIK